jgi:hypothetical protein
VYFNVLESRRFFHRLNYCKHESAKTRSSRFNDLDAAIPYISTVFLQERCTHKRLKLDFHAFGCGAHFGIVILRVGDDLVDDGVSVVGIVVVED